MWVNRHHRLILILLTWVAFGGAEDDPKLMAPISKDRIDPSLIDDDAATYDFGAILGTTERRVSHRYHLSNTNKHDIKIIDLINCKPCCGEVGIGTRILRPGGETDVEITLRVGGRFGDVVHNAVLVTEPPHRGNSS